MLGFELEPERGTEEFYNRRENKTALHAQALDCEGCTRLVELVLQRRWPRPTSHAVIVDESGSAMYCELQRGIL